MSKSFLNYVCDVILLGYEIQDAPNLINYLVDNKERIGKRLNFEKNNSFGAMRRLIHKESGDFKELSDYVKKYYSGD